MDHYWLNRTQPRPTSGRLAQDNPATRVHKLAIKRLSEIEKDMRAHGIEVHTAAELEYFILDKNGVPIQKSGVEMLSTLHCYSRSYKEQAPGKHELVLESKTSPTELIHAIDMAKMQLPEIASSQGIAKVLFEPYELHSDSTAGLHINSSARDATTKENLFYDKLTGAHSILAKKSADRLLALQYEGLTAYAPQDLSYKRFNKHANAPRVIQRAIEEDGVFTTNASVIMRKGSLKERAAKPEEFRIEDRLAGADVDPAVALLASVGAIYEEMPWRREKSTKINVERFPIVLIDTPVVRDKLHANFCNSKQWKNIAGSELFEAMKVALEPPAKGSVSQVRS